MPELRANAQRSRRRILEIARTHDRHDLRHNDLAREAGVGVGTVYRHFPTSHALLEALAADALERLHTACQQALLVSDPWRSIESLIDAAVTLQLQDSGLQDVLLADASDAPDIGAMKEELFAAAAAIVERGHRAGVLRPGLTAAHLQHLTCGIEHAIRLGSPEDRDLLQQALLDGIRRQPGG